MRKTSSLAAAATGALASLLISFAFSPAIAQGRTADAGGKPQAADRAAVECNRYAAHFEPQQEASPRWRDLAALASDCPWCASTREFPEVPSFQIRADRAIAACARAVGLAADLPVPAWAKLRYTHQLGRAYFKAKDYARAVETYRIAAEGGYAAAQGTLGSMLLNGQGVARDVDAGLRWIEKAATAGDPWGELDMSIAYRDGLGVPKSLPEAFKWATESAETGLPEGQSQLGSFYATGTGTPASAADALDLLGLAADAGLPYANLNLGVMAVVNGDLLDAERYYKAALDNNVRGPDESVIKPIVESALITLQARRQGLHARPEKATQ